MIDPKLNELPVSKGDAVKPEDSSVTSPEAAERSRVARQGLSINDTVAADANLSTGSRGTDTSGVRAGAGAGAGSTYVTPARPGENPMPNITSPPAGSGTTPISDRANSQTSRSSWETDRSPSASQTEEFSPTPEEISSRAYRRWHERGCPEGSPEEDWHRAEKELREKGHITKVSSTTA